MSKQSTLDISRLKFLIVEGDENMREMVGAVLRSFHVEDLHHTKTGEEAVKFLETQRPDIILCEWELEKLNGIELTKKIRSGECGHDRQVAIIFLTAHTQMSQVMQARDSGITEFLAKPISAQTLYRRIVSVIEKPRAFIEADGFIGPDRRRKRDPYKVGLSRRTADKMSPEESAASVVSDDEIDAMLNM
ncbi:MAG: hypothetical protein A2516_04055 [Alphaproteobacteria bacterium RIFOXYD12_FULL_60_8]|nr:MAG: hypothetical protein A2516_04055 [Alphaproteobacteria bacterium RIFOXYD12_FULL_60_8]